MGEIDTKSIESVQAALSLFGEKSDQKRSWPACDNPDKEKELEHLLKDLTNFKFQLEAKNSAHKQTLLRIDHYQKTADELFILLKNTEFERDIYINECREARTGIDELESKIKEMEEQLSESVKIRGELSHVISELKSTKGELLNMEVELVAARDAKLEATKQAELMETALNMEKGKTAELLGHVSELNETILHLQLAAVEAEKEKTAVLSEKQAELLLATKSVVETQEELESMRNQLKLMQNLENKLLEKSLLIESLQLELQRVNELHNSAEKAASDAANDINLLISDMELLVRENSNKGGHINSLEMDLSRLKLELKNANEEVDRLNCDVETITDKFEKIRRKVEEVSATEREAQVEIALLKSELHRGRSKTAAAEAAEERAKREISALHLATQQLHLATQQLASEAEEAKKEIRGLKEEAGKWDEETRNYSQDEEVPEIDESKSEEEKRGDETERHVTVSVEEYEALVKKAEKADQAQETKSSTRQEMEILKKELEITTARIGEFRTRAEQAACRAEVAETAKAALEEQIRRWREQKERRKAALVALRVEPITSRKKSFRKDVEPPKIYQPLGKILNMK